MTHVHNHTNAEGVYPFDARGIAKRFRHAAIFGALDASPRRDHALCQRPRSHPHCCTSFQARYGEKATIWYLQNRDTDGVVIDFARQ